MSFKTTIEYLDGKIVEITHRHMIRADGKDQVYRVLDERPRKHNGFLVESATEESTIPYCVVRKVSTEIGD